MNLDGGYTINHILDICAKPYFFGFIDSNASTELLKDTPPGTYLMRFSLSNPGSYVLSVSYCGISTHWRISCSKDIGKNPVYNIEGKDYSSFENIAFVHREKGGEPLKIKKVKPGEPTDLVLTGPCQRPNSQSTVSYDDLPPGPPIPTEHDKDSHKDDQHHKKVMPTSNPNPHIKLPPGAVSLTSGPLKLAPTKPKTTPTTTDSSTESKPAPKSTPTTTQTITPTAKPGQKSKEEDEIALLEKKKKDAVDKGDYDEAAIIKKKIAVLQETIDKKKKEEEEKKKAHSTDIPSIDNLEKKLKVCVDNADYDQAAILKKKNYFNQRTDCKC